MMPIRDLNEEVRTAVRRKVDGLHVTLWLDWDISQPQRKEAAIQYMTNFILEVLGEVFSPYERDGDEQGRTAEDARLPDENL